MAGSRFLARIVIILLFNVIYNVSHGQSPNKMNFQVVIRDSIGDLVIRDTVGIKISILQSSISGTVVYSETHKDSTNSNGLLTLEIGGGSVISGVFADIDWTNGPYFVKREIDPTGGMDYGVGGTEQILSVPYALYANVADTALNTPPRFDRNYTSLTNKPDIPSKTSDLTHDSGWLTTEVDGSATNEIQTISKMDRTVTLSNSGGSFVDSVLTEAQVDSFANNNGYLTIELDGSNSNEIQTISKVDRTVTLSNNGGSFVDSILTEAQVDSFANKFGYLTIELDSSTTNEIQTISKVDRTVTLSNNGGSFVDSVLTEAQIDSFANKFGYLTIELDSSTTNEIQTISKVDRTVTLSNNGGSFVDSVLTEAQVDAYISNNGYLTAEVDGSATNEIQDLSFSVCENPLYYYPLNWQNPLTSLRECADTLYLSSSSNNVIIPKINNPPSLNKCDDAHVYDTVHIGTQVWFAENLRKTCYNDGTFIPNVTDQTEWSSLGGGSLEPGKLYAARAYYDNDSTQYVEPYGALYNFHAVESDQLCPTGWHVPNAQEWGVLRDYLGGEDVAGGKLKEVGNVHWQYHSNGGATDEVGFTAVPGGYRRTDAYDRFERIGLDAYYWTDTHRTYQYSWNVKMFYADDYLEIRLANERDGNSVRCLRD